MYGSMNQKLKIKLLILGESTVGKTSLMRRYDQNQFVNTSPTTCLDLSTTELTINNEKVLLQIWDTVGQERYRSLTISLFQGSSGVVLAFDLTNRTSFDLLRKWMSEITKKLDSGFQMILVGTKSDLADQIRVTQTDIDEFVSEQSSVNIKYFKTSSFDGTNVRESFIYLAEQVYNAVQAKNIVDDDLEIPIDGKEDGKQSMKYNHQSSVLRPENHVSIPKEKKNRKCC